MNKIKRLYNFTIDVFKILFNVDKRKVAFRKAYSIFKEFGWIGVVKAIKNKASKRQLLDGIVGKEVGEMDYPPYSGSVFISGDNTGRRLFHQQQEEYSESTLKQMTEELKKKSYFSIVLLIDRAEINMLKSSIKSIRSQLYNRWEVLAVDMGAKDRRGVNLLGGEAERDSRIHLLELNGQKIEEAEAYNLALSKALGDFIIFMHPGDQLTPDALYWVAKSLDDGENIDLLFSDECHVDERDNYFNFFFKPAWSPLLLIRSSYPGNLSVFRKAALQECGEFDQGFDRCALYEMTLRLSNRGGEVRHIERILYLTYAIEKTEEVRQMEKTSRVKALSQHMWRMNYSASIYERDGHNFISKWRSETPLVSVVIATDNATAILGGLPQLLRDTAYPNFEIVIVANSELSEEIGEAMPGLGERLILLPYDGPLNISRKYNLGAAAAKGEYLVFLSDDMYIAQRDWLNHLLDILDFPGIGAVSPAVIDSEGSSVYMGGRIGQHGGELYSTFPGQSFYSNDDRALTSHISREVSVLSKYCFSVRKEVFFHVGGLNEKDTPNRYFELDFSFRIQEKKFRCAFVSTSVLFNKVRHEVEYSSPRDRSYLYMIKQWHAVLERDSLFTDSMLKYSTDRDKLPNRLHLPKSILKGEKGNILLVSHELSRTGSPQVVFEAAKVLKDQGYFPVVASPEDGPLSKDILAEEIPVIIDQDLSKYRAYRPNEVPKSISPGIDNLLRNFDLVLVASIVNHNFINCYNGSDIPLLWWIHDGGTGYSFLENYLPNHLKNNISVFCGGRYAQEMLEKCRPQYHTEVLLYGVKDWAADMKEITLRQEKVLFLFPATFEIRKNQLLLLEAIGMLPEPIAQKADFLLIGKVGDELYYRSIENKAKELPNVKISGPVPYDKLMDIYRETACVVVPSIDDPMPVVLTEAMMMSKIVLCSDMTGTARYIEDGVNGFLFSSKDASELEEKLEYVIGNFDTMDDVRKAGRKTYEQYFSQEIFSENFGSVVEKNIIRFTEDNE